MKLYYRKSKAYLYFKLEKLSLRERIIILLAMLVAMFVLWQLLLFDMQLSLKKSVETKLGHTNEQLGIIKQEISRIEQDMASKMVKNEIDQYLSLTSSINSYQKNIVNYKQETMSEKKLINMLSSIFKEIKSIEVISFFSLHNKSSLLNGKLPKKDSSLFKKYYKLQLIGDYFAVMNYLQKIESLPWHIYWDEMRYQVIKHPKARVELVFHAMSKHYE